jgi:hypothetical protein
VAWLTLTCRNAQDLLAPIYELESVRPLLVIYPTRVPTMGEAMAQLGELERRHGPLARQAAAVLIDATIQNKLKSAGLKDQQIAAEIAKRTPQVPAPTGIN